MFYFKSNIFFWILVQEVKIFGVNCVNVIGFQFKGFSFIHFTRKQEEDAFQIRTRHFRNKAVQYFMFIIYN